MAAYGEWYFNNVNLNEINFDDKWKVCSRGSFVQFEKFIDFTRKSVYLTGTTDADFSKVTSARMFFRDPNGTEFEIDPDNVSFISESSSTYTRYYLYFKLDSRVSEYNTEDKDLEKLIVIFYKNNEPYLYYSVAFTIAKTWGSVYNIPLDMNPKALPTYLYFSQDLDEASLIFSLFASEGVLEAIRKAPAGSSLAQNVIAELRGTRSDGSQLVIPAIFTEATTQYSEWSVSYIHYPLVTINGLAELTSIPGDTVFSIVLIWNNTEISSSRCIAHVELKP